MPGGIKAGVVCTKGEGETPNPPDFEKHSSENSECISKCTMDQSLTISLTNSLLKPVSFHSHFRLQECEAINKS